MPWQLIWQSFALRLALRRRLGRPTTQSRSDRRAGPGTRTGTPNTDPFSASPTGRRTSCACPSRPPQAMPSSAMAPGSRRKPPNKIGVIGATQFQQAAVQQRNLDMAIRQDGTLIDTLLAVRPHHLNRQERRGILPRKPETWTKQPLEHEIGVHVVPPRHLRDRGRRGQALHRPGKADAERLHERFNGRLRDELLNEESLRDSLTLGESLLSGDTTTTRSGCTRPLMEPRTQMRARRLRRFRAPHPVHSQTHHQYDMQK